MPFNAYLGRLGRRNVKPKDRRSTKTLLVAFAMHGISLRPAALWPRENEASDRVYGNGGGWSVSIYTLKNGRYLAETRRTDRPYIRLPQRKTFREALVEALHVIENNE